MSATSNLRDFRLDRRVLMLSAVSLVIGAGGAGLAVVLSKLIGLMTNLFYFNRVGFALVSPANTALGPVRVLIPVVGGLIVGLMARYGSDKIRGHGIPEAMEAILLRGAKVEPRLAILKPISAAIAIGSGGPFGAEGPIIMTGSAFGSLVAQSLHLTDNERTVLLVAGAAAGMSATFAAPFAAVLLAVELLLFEWRPRSLVPVVVASVTAGILRVLWLGAGPTFPSAPLNFAWNGRNAGIALFLGLIVGLAAALLSRMVYGCEDLFEHLPLHWAWWPAIGGLGVGIGGLFFPRALGVGYDVIGLLLAGHAVIGIIIGVLLVKSSIWAFRSRLWNIWRRAGSSVDVGSGSGRNVCAGHARRRGGNCDLGIDRHGRDAGRVIGRTADGDCLFA
jgi:H+/Cl- antiporter ClcA